jgi:hypothetical protein
MMLLPDTGISLISKRMSGTREMRAIHRSIVAALDSHAPLVLQFFQSGVVAASSVVQSISGDDAVRAS